MGYSSESYRRVKDELRVKRERAEAEATARRSEIHDAHPDIAALDAALSETGMRLFKIALEGGAGRLERLREENAAMLELRAKMLAAAGYPADVTEPRYECAECHDSGYVGTRMCACMRRALILESFRESGIGGLIDRQSFENFSLDYYRDERERSEMSFVFSRAKKFAETFGTPDAPCRNLMFIGGTGLGKTHLSTAIARRVIERGYDVKYESAPNIISDFEAERFGGERYYSRGASLTDKYFECDLLIIDDLGAELVNQFTVSCLYNLINTRQNRGLGMLISTNLDGSELRSLYNDRITSRLFGEFDILRFRGRDNRGL